MSLAPAALVYAPALESASAVSLRESYGLYLGGAWSAADDGASFATENPATEETLALVARAGRSDVDRAVGAARRGYDKYWRKLRAPERAKYLYRIARLLGERAREYAALETLDSGKPIRAARDVDVAHAVAHFFYHAGWADKLEYATGPHERARSLGVVAAIASWEAPVLVAARKIAPALACGNTVVFKPSETTPLCALLLAQAAADADLPPGVLNVLTGDVATGAALAEHAGVDMVSLTGSAETGKTLRRATAGSGTRLAMQLGGKSALIVFEDAPLDQALESIAAALTSDGSRIGGTGSRVLVQESIADEVVARLRERLTTLRHGDPLDRNTDIGAMPSRGARERLAACVAAAVAEGAELTATPWTAPERGAWFPASFLTNVQPTYRVAREDVAGPVLSIMTFRTADEALERANNVPSGLAAGVWTSSGSLALYMAARLRVGVVWCNSFDEQDPSAPFGGFKESGLGREGGLAGLKMYLE